MERQGRMLKSFLTMDFGGPDSYAGKSLRHGHRHLVDQGLNDEHFDAVAGHIKTTLEDLKVPAELVDQVMGAAASLRSEVLNKPEVVVAPEPTETSEEPVAVVAEGSSDEGVEATPVKPPRARKTSGTGTARSKKAVTAETPAEQEVPVTAD